MMSSPSHIKSPQAILVVGPTGKAGSAVVDRLQAAGFAVIGAARSTPNDPRLVEALRLDLDDDRSIAEVARRVTSSDPELRGVVVCAAGFYRGATLDASSAQIASSISTTLTGAVDLAVSLARSSTSRPFDVINITAANAAAVLDASRSSPLHVATKSAIHAFSALAGLELDTHGIRLSTIAPGTLEKAPGDGGIPVAAVADAVMHCLTIPASVRAETIVLRPTGYRSSAN